MEECACVCGIQEEQKKGGEEKAKLNEIFHKEMGKTFSFSNLEKSVAVVPCRY